MDKYTGGCLCGQVRVVAMGRPYRVGLCHCLDCRKHHGALFHASAIFPQDAVSIEGETRDYAGRRERAHEAALTHAPHLRPSGSDLGLRHGKGFSRGNLIRFRQFYRAYPDVAAIGATLSHQLTWSHIVELLKVDVCHFQCF